VRRPSIFRAAALGVVLVLAVVMHTAACGGDGNQQSPTAAASATPESSPSAEVSATPAFPVSVTDSSSTTVTFTEAPKRIISYSPGATEVLFAVGAAASHRIDKFSDYPAETSTKTRLEYSKPPPRLRWLST